MASVSTAEVAYLTSLLPISEHLFPFTDRGEELIRWRCCPGQQR